MRGEAAGPRLLYFTVFGLLDIEHILLLLLLFMPWWITVVCSYRGSDCNWVL